MFRNMEVKILEIGVAGGASLKVWESFFRHGTIIGADINPTAKKFARERINIEIIDQSNSEDLLQLGRSHGPFDIVIEDGSHMWAHQIITFKTLFPFVKEGGIYIVEDLQTNYGSMQIGFRGDSTISCVDYIKKLVDIRVADTKIDVAEEGDGFLRDYGRKVDSITFYRESCLITKKRKSAVLDESLILLENDEAAKYLTLRAHIGGYGGRTALGAVIRGGDVGHDVQGFSILCNELIAKRVLYRARLADGSWTEWVHSGTFVGTSGKSQDLTGFSVGLSNECGDQYDLTLVGAFRDSSANVVVGNGEACVSKAPGASLCGMQISIVRRET